MLEVSKLKKKDFLGLLEIVQTKMKLGIITDDIYDQNVWISQPNGRKLYLSDEATWKLNNTCGCSACIGGWMAIEAGLSGAYEVNSFINLAIKKAGMDSLFFDNLGPKTVKQAIRAINYFFAGFRDPWKRRSRCLK